MQLVTRTIATLLAATWIGCAPEPTPPSSSSAAQARSRGVLVAEYTVPDKASTGEYRVVEVWVERAGGTRELLLVVRLAGPHVGTEPRMQVAGLKETDYRTVWSERDGPPYEVWSAPTPLPETLTLRRSDTEVQLRRRPG